MLSINAISHNHKIACCTSCKVFRWLDLTATTRIRESASSTILEEVSLSKIESILVHYDYNQRLVRISTDQLPVLAEVYVNGIASLARILSFQISNVSGEPKFCIEFVQEDSPQKQDASTGNSVVIDAGQITTIWEHNLQNDEKQITSDPRRQQKLLSKMIRDEIIRIPNKFIEDALDRLYKSYVGRARSSSSKNNENRLTKKQIDNIALVKHKNETENELNLFSFDNEQEQMHVVNILRKVIKSGTGFSRIVDSTIMKSFMYNVRDAANGTISDRSRTLLHRAVASQVLADDSETGGRFKRWPCVFLSLEQQDQLKPQVTKNYGNNDYKNSTAKAHKAISISLINGGWLVVDQSVRAGSEARKFAQRNLAEHVDSFESKNCNENNSKLGATVINSKIGTDATTFSDERIIRRLECLAMGEYLTDSSYPKSNNNLNNDDRRKNCNHIELDVRETLKTMKLPLSPDGAKQALISIGRWSGKSPVGPAFQPWSKDVLEAAAFYVEISKRRQEQYKILFNDKSKSNHNNVNKEDFIDLTSLPCVSIDAKRTTFRDDAIGVRPRMGTGREMNPDASKWEILVHITDVSDIYCTPTPPFCYDTDDAAIKNGNVTFISVLQKAAASRGTSRYDLPLGPLHLLPPVVLRSLSLSTSSSFHFHRCVTLWAYIDERNGRLLDTGIERTIISTPTQVSYLDATEIMDGNFVSEESISLTLQQQQKLRALLLVAERSLKRWGEQRRTRSEVAKKRESRLAAKEYQTHGLALSSAHNPFPNKKYTFRDERYVFERTRGHRFVDFALDLYSFVSMASLKKAGAPIPKVLGADASRGGRVATAPLRRYIDGISQKQILSVLCNYGQRMTASECQEAGKVANDARNKIANIRSIKRHNDCQ